MLLLKASPQPVAGELEKIKENIKNLEGMLKEVIYVVRGEYDLNTRTSYLLSIPSRVRKMGAARELIQNILQTERIFFEVHCHHPWETTILESIQNRMEQMVFCAGVSDISFEDLSALIILNLGLDLAKNVVNQDTVLKVYGVEAKNKWGNILEESVGVE